MIHQTSVRILWIQWYQPCQIPPRPSQRQGATSLASVEMTMGDAAG